MSKNLLEGIGVWSVVVVRVLGVRMEDKFVTHDDDCSASSNALGMFLRVLQFLGGSLVEEHRLIIAVVVLLNVFGQNTDGL